MNRLKETLKASLKYSMSYVIIASTSLVLFGCYIIKLFGGDEKLLSITTHGLNIMLLGTIFVPITILSAMLFQGIGKVKEV
nr:MATE family efflux transporter [Desulforamulus aquiferis]